MIKQIRPDPVPAISWTFSEGRYWDLWMIVHALSGALAGCVVVLLGYSPLYAYPAALVALAAWELGEMAFGIKEEPENWVLDIVFGMFGFWFVYEKVIPDMGLMQVTAVGAVLLLFNGLFALLGWRAYRKRAN